MRKTASMLWLSVSLALQDLVHDRKINGTLVFAIASILAPLLLLLGLKTGIVVTAKQDLLNDPRNLEVIIYQNTRLSVAWVEEMTRHPDTRFVIPLTRTINATIDLVNDDNKGIQSVEMVPTASGDPLLPPNIDMPGKVDTVLISASVAQRLSLEEGDRITGVIKRRINGVNQQARLALYVLAVLPEHSFVRDAIFTSLDFLVATEDYRDGYQVPVLDIEQGQKRESPRQEFASARIYASGLDEVLSLAKKLRTQGLDVRTRAADIEAIKRIDQLLTFVFMVISTIAGIGGAVAMGSSVWLNVDRKRESLALLRLMGLFDTGVLLVPLVEALIVAFFGYILAYVFYLIGAQIFNEQLGASLPEYGYACRLYHEHIAIMLGLVLLFTVIVSSLAGIRASRLDPAVCLRESV